MSSSAEREEKKDSSPYVAAEDDPSKMLCPLCGQALLQEKCKVVCRSPICGYRIVYNCSEF